MIATPPVPLTVAAAKAELLLDYAPAIAKHGYHLVSLRCTVNDDGASGMCLARLTFHKYGQAERVVVAISVYLAGVPGIYWQSWPVFCAIGNKITRC